MACGGVAKDPLTEPRPLKNLKSPSLPSSSLFGNLDSEEKIKDPETYSCNANPAPHCSTCTRLGKAVSIGVAVSLLIFLLMHFHVVLPSLSDTDSSTLTVGNTIFELLLWKEV